MKKKLLALGSIATLVAPIASVVSCGQKDFKIIDLEDKDIAFLSDGHSLTDGSFNQQIFEGVKSATNERVIALAPNITGSKSMTSFYDKQIKDGKKLLVLGGFEHSKVLGEYASKHKETNFIMIDSEVKGKNIASVVFSMKEIGFIAGFRMAHYVSKQSKKQIGIYGGMAIGPVQDYIQGVKKGIQYYDNHGKNKATKVIIDDKGFVGSFDKEDPKSIEFATSLVKNSSLILSVGGPQYKDVLKAIGSKADVKLVGVDLDIKSVVADGDKGKIWGSILKNLKETTTKIISDMKEDYTEHVGHTYVGNVANGGTGLAIGNETLDKNFGITQEMLDGNNLSPKNVLAAAKQI